MTIDEAIQHCKEVAKENRKTALEYARAYAWDTAHGCRECANEHEKLASWLVELKERRERTRWIPCSARLPKSSEDVLVWFEYFRYGEYNCMYQTYNIGNYVAKYDLWMVGHETGWKDLRVIAWMPLPEPPKEGEENA